jgi:hypothetical protein
MINIPLMEGTEEGLVGRRCPWQGRAACDQGRAGTKRRHDIGVKVRKRKDEEVREKDEGEGGGRDEGERRKKR